CEAGAKPQVFDVDAQTQSQHTSAQGVVVAGQHAERFRKRRRGDVTIEARLTARIDFQTEPVELGRLPVAVDDENHRGVITRHAWERACQGQKETAPQAKRLYNSYEVAVHCTSIATGQ